jgi:ornithine cyclodeaminase/alanine dehydrogenase-like protein (mu-crystallin family)
MEILIINQDEVAQLLPMADCIEAMAGALQALARKKAVNPLRYGMWLDDRSGILALMPAQLVENSLMGVKVIAIFPGNHGTEFDSHQGTVMIFDTDHGRPLAILDASEITALRTAAVSGVATRQLARPDASRLAMLGSGVQAGTHLEAMLLVREIRQVTVWSRRPDHAAEFARRQSEQHNIEIQVAGTAREAVEDADIICTTTASPDPILLGEWLHPGMHINAIGSSVPSMRELDTEAVVRSRMIVDRQESVRAEGGEFICALEEGAIGEDHIAAELGEVLLGEIAGRETDEQITLFKSLGLAVEDLAAAELVYHRALEQQLGTSVELGGKRPK